MASSAAKTVAEYLEELPVERRKVIASVRKMIREHLPKGYIEAMNWGMISYEVPLKRYPQTYNGQPLMYVALAAQKNNYALYLMSVYGDTRQAAWLQEQFRKAGKKMDMGKSCLRFKKLEDLPLDAIAQIVAHTAVDDLIAVHEAVHGRK